MTESNTPAPLPDLGSKFEVLGELGRGGMGAVYRVRHRKLDHVRAVKLLRFDATDVALERLRREAAVATELAHPSIVHVYDLEELPDGSLAIVMECLDGEDLGERLRRDGPLEVGAVVALFGGVVDALDRMHARGVVHRDLKPANLFLCAEGPLKILDFGIARLSGGGEDLTASGTMVGTPAFMAPEQFKGEETTARADIYALGAVLYYCLTGQLPVQGETQAEVIAHVLFETPPRADELRPAVPASAAAVLARALAKDPAERYPSASALLAALADPAGDSSESETVAWSGARPVVREPTVAMTSTGGAAPVPPPRVGKRAWPWAMTIPVVTVVVAALWFAVFRPEADPAADAAVEAPPPDPGIPAVEPVSGGTLRAAVGSPIASLDPLMGDKNEAQIAVSNLLYDPLVDLDWSGELVPALATDWEVRDDHRQFVLSLRPDARFHDDPCFPDGRGRFATAADARRSLERSLLAIARDPDHPLQSLSPVVGLTDVLEGRAEHLAGLRALDEHTLEVTFERPVPEFLQILSWSTFVVVAAEALDAYGADGEMGLHAVGTGPWRVAPGGSAAAMTLLPQRQSGHTDGGGRPLPYLDRLEITAFSGNIATLTALREGKVDVIFGASRDMVGDAFEISGRHVTPREGWGNHQLGGFLDDVMRQQTLIWVDRRSSHPLASDPRLRRAVGHALRRGELVDDTEVPLTGPLADGMAGYHPEDSPVEDPLIARQLLSEAGYPGGVGLPPVRLCAVTSFQDEMTTLREQLAEVDITVTAIAAQPDSMMHYLRDGGCDAMIFHFMGLVVDGDPGEFLISYAHFTELPGRDPEAAALIDELRGVGDRERRAEVVRALARRMADDSCAIVLYHRLPGVPDMQYVASSRVQGLLDPRTGLMNPRRQRLRELWVAGGEELPE